MSQKRHSCKQIDTSGVHHSRRHRNTIKAPQLETDRHKKFKPHSETEKHKQVIPESDTNKSDKKRYRIYFQTNDTEANSGLRH